MCILVSVGIRLQFDDLFLNIFPSNKKTFMFKILLETPIYVDSL